MASAGLSLGLGTLLGGIIGAIGGVGAATIYNSRHRKEGIDISWSERAAQDFMLESLLLYLAVAHFGAAAATGRKAKALNSGRRPCRTP